MLNIAVLMGRLTADPELRHTPNGVAVTRFTLAVERTYVKSGAERQADFIDIVAWRNTAEFVSKYFHKGQLVAVDGSIQTGSYQDKDGNKRRTFEIVASNVHFAEPKRDSYNDNMNNNQPEYSGFNEGVSTSASSYENGSNEDFQEVPSDDDLPF